VRWEHIKVRLQRDFKKREAVCFVILLSDSTWFVEYKITCKQTIYLPQHRRVPPPVARLVVPAVATVSASASRTEQDSHLGLTSIACMLITVTHAASRTTFSNVARLRGHRRTRTYSAQPPTATPGSGPNYSKCGRSRHGLWAHGGRTSSHRSTPHTRVSH